MTPSRLALALLGLLAAARPASAVPSDYYWCGTSWANANEQCETQCPGGQDSECPAGESCFADCTNCNASPPSASPPSASPPASGPVSNSGGDDSRMVAFLGNWQSCPPASGGKMDQYTHIVVSFAVSYTWAASKNDCDAACTISTPVPICDNGNNQALVDSWRAQGKKVLVSFGGAGMGGSWSNDPNDCWEHCFGKEASVVSQLKSIVQNQNFDGVDIDYEYFYEDADFPQTPSKGLATSTGAMARTFIDQVTSGLKAELPAGQNLVTHAPMDADVVSGSSYYQILANNAQNGNLDFVMPQYYNGIVNPVSNGLTGVSDPYISALSHFDNLVTNMFSGDATKVVFGFCISDCPNYNIAGSAAAAVMSDLTTYHSCNGGAFFWVSEHDANNGDWSSVVNSAIQPQAGCSAGEPTAPMPTATPPAPTPPAPTPAAPTPGGAGPGPRPTSPATAPTNPASCPATDNSGAAGGCGPSSPCVDSTLCCSQWGWCGTGAGYCDTCCQHNCDGGNPAPTTPAPMTTTTTTTTAVPTKVPTLYPTTDAPTKNPTTDAPTKNPTTTTTTTVAVSTKVPTLYPTTDAPTKKPTTDAPTKNPTTDSPTSNPTGGPTDPPVPAPTLAGDGQPCSQPSDCQSAECSGGNPANRVCLAPAVAPTPEGTGPAPTAPAAAPTQGCKASGVACDGGGECCLGVCKGNPGRCK